ALRQLDETRALQNERLALERSRLDQTRDIQNRRLALAEEEARRGERERLRRRVGNRAYAIRNIADPAARAREANRFFASSPALSGTLGRHGFQPVADPEAGRNVWTPDIADRALDYLIAESRDPLEIRR